ncbi:MAG: transcription elongation factor GreA [Enterobacteriaceae bacterium]|nr:transcription elongation factor GreA [Enterobacteriaceae bacterium]
MQKIPMTETGFKKLQQELKILKQINRPKIINEIQKARAHGDLKENAEYHAAKEEQFIIESKIKEIENKLPIAEIIDVKKFINNGKIIFGSTVKLTNMKTGQTVAYKIVGEDESNIIENKISIQSPIAKALIGKFIKNQIEINIPDGKVKYEINEVEYI